MVTITQADVRWKNHPDIPGIEISNTGIVREINSGHIIPTRGSGGRKFVRVQDFHGNVRVLVIRRVVRHLFGHMPVQVAESQEPQELREAEQSQEAEEVSTDCAWADIEHPDINPGYRVSVLGEVITPRGVILRGSSHKSRDGHNDSRSVQLARRPGSSDLIGHVRVRVDELVAQYHMEPAPTDDHQLMHLNGDPDDCRAENLEWAIMPVDYARDKTTITVRSNRNRKRAMTMSKTMAKILAGDPDWKQVVSTQIAPRRYWVHRDARVMGIYGHELKVSMYQDGHLCAHIQSAVTGHTTTVRLDELMLDAWVGPRPSPLHRATHRNGNASDCRMTNLYWGIPGQAEPVTEPTPVPAAPTPTPRVMPRISALAADDVEVSTVTSYRYDGVEMRVGNDGRVDLPEVTVENAAALAKLLGKISQQRPASE